MQSLIADFKSFMIGIFLMFILFAMGDGWYYFHTLNHATTNQPADKAPEIQKILTESVPIKTVQVYPDKEKKKLSLPADIQSDDKERVTGATKIAPSSHPETITSVLNTDTGLTQLYVRPDALPWLLPEKHTTINIDYGFKNSAKVMRFSAREDLLQVKALHLGPIGQIDSDGQWFVGVGVSMSW